MSFQLVIAEKPSVAHSIAAVIGADEKQNGYWQGGGYLVSWCIGHLVSFAEAGQYDEKYCKWRYEDLPILPQPWQFIVPDEKKQQFEIVRALLNRPDVDSVTAATDAGREGELIFRFVYQMAGCTKPVKRLWISSMEDAAIREGFANLRPDSDYDALYQSALCRAKADWLVGINATRLFSVLYHKTLTVGRVQTPTLKMLVDRDAKILRFQKDMFSGLLVCADCGCNLHFHFNQGNPEIKYFNCSNYKGNRGTCQSTHYIRVDFLEEVVLGETRRLTKFASLYENDFLKAVIGHSQQADEADRKLKKKELKALLARDEELDGLFERIYEDNVSGKLSNERFSRMSRRYEDEQKELTEKIKQLRSEIEKQSSRTMTTDMFISLVRKYTRAKKLTPRMLNELVEKIEVFNAEKVNGVWEQRLRIHYNCVGTIKIPSALPLPTPDVSVNTRKGVVVNYAPCDVAI